MRYDADAFERLVAEALDDLPEWIQERMDNVAVLTQPWPSTEQLRLAHIGREMTLLGLYEGVPLTKRGRGYQLIPPDRITLFQGPLENSALDQEALQEAVRCTVIHEVAHHFGMSDAQLAELGI